MGRSVHNLSQSVVICLTEGTSNNVGEALRLARERKIKESMDSAKEKDRKSLKKGF